MTARRLSLVQRPEAGRRRRGVRRDDEYECQEEATAPRSRAEHETVERQLRDEQREEGHALHTHEQRVRTQGARRRAAVAMPHARGGDEDEEEDRRRRERHDDRQPEFTIPHGWKSPRP